MPELQEMRITVAAETDPEKSAITGRNGTTEIREVKVWSCYNDRVYIEGISTKRRIVINGGLCLTPKAMDEICSKWLEARGLINTQEEAA